MPCLADTNVLLRLVQRNDRDHRLVCLALKTLNRRGEQICFAPQNLVEFWCVCTRPVSVNGFGLTIEETDPRSRTIERIFTLLQDGLEVHREWRRLVVAHGVSGVQVHDARLVALMRVHALTTVLTFDVHDFTQFPGVTAVHPRDIAPV